MPDQNQTSPLPRPNPGAGSVGSAPKPQAPTPVGAPVLTTSQQQPPAPLKPLSSDGTQPVRVMPAPPPVSSATPVSPSPTRQSPASPIPQAPLRAASPTSSVPPPSVGLPPKTTGLVPSKPLGTVPSSTVPPSLGSSPPQQLGSKPPSFGGSPPKPPASFEQKPDLAEKPVMGAKPPSPTGVKKSPFRFLPFILIGLALIAGIWFAVTRLFGGLGGTTPQSQEQSGQQGTTGRQRTVTWWGLWEPSGVIDEVIADFKTQHPDITVNYVQQSPTDYRERLQDAIRRGTGPDIFRYHATWVPMLRTQLAVLPASVMSADEFSSTFYPVAAKDLKTTEGIVGIPLMYDGLGLYYNKQLFAAAGKPPPSSWSELETVARELTVRTGTRLDRGGVALGTTSNVEHFPEVIALLMMQNGTSPSSLTSTLASDAFRYYTNFTKTHQVWDDTMPASTYAFATEKVAMFFGPSWRAFEIKAINPNLDFAIAPVPQLPGTDVAFASYWAEGVSKSSKESEASWTFLKYMSSKEVQQKFHDAAATGTPRLFGEIFSRQDMASLVASDPYMGAYVTDAPIASSWYMSSRTFDNGINDRIIKYIEDAVNAINSGSGSLTGALTTADQGVKQVLQQFGITAQ